MRASLNTSLKLKEQEYSFILDIIKKCESSGGGGLSKTAIFRALVRLLQQLDVDLSGVENEDQLIQRLQDAIKNK